MGFSNVITPSTPVELKTRNGAGVSTGPAGFFFKKTAKGGDLKIGWSESSVYLHLAQLNPPSSAVIQGPQVALKGGFLRRASPRTLLRVKQEYSQSCLTRVSQPFNFAAADFNSYAWTPAIALFFIPSNRTLPIAEFTVIRHISEQTQLALTLCSKATKLRGIFTVFELNPEKRAKLSVAPHYAVLAEIPAASIAAMFGYTRRFQRASFIRVSFFKHLRRYVLTLNSLSLEIHVMGVLRQFKLLFKTLNAPTNQMFKHPLHNGYLADIACIPHKVVGQVSSREELCQHIKALLLENALVPDDSLAELTAEAADDRYVTLVSELTAFFWPHFQKILFEKPTNRAFRRETLIRRYTLQWNKVIFLKTTPHTLLKKKRARSIKKRRTKRLVKKAKYRFWAL